jgi:release factor glutamine methyltransferase
MDGKTLEVAKMNAITHGVESQVRFVRTNWAEALLQEASKFDLIVSNPPYLTPEELSCIEPTVSKFEPWRGLVGGRDGLSAYKAIASQAQHLLNVRRQCPSDLGDVHDINFGL